MDKETMKFIRMVKNLSVREFANELGVSYSLISRIEGGERTLTKRLEQKVLTLFEITEEKLVAIKMLIDIVK